MPVIHPPAQIGPLRWDWSRTLMLGVVNVTPDSFSDGGRYADADAAIAHGLRLVEDGADALDIGGESTRPGASAVAAEVELQRVLPVIRALAERCDVPISIDTYKAAVAEAALQAGATIINDISGLRLDDSMAQTAARGGAVLVLGHLRGRPATMMDHVAFSDVVAEVTDELRESIRRAIDAGVAADRIWVDPGLGFGKQPEHSLALLRATGELREQLGYPLMVGASRKSFIGRVTGQRVEQRMVGSCAASAAAVVAGADAVRIHDVAGLLPAIRVADAIRRGCPGRER